MNDYALVLNADGTGELFSVAKSKQDKDPNYPKLRDAVGGYIEYIRLAEDLFLVCNEEGKLERLPFNETATALVKSLYEANGMSWDDFIVGNVVFIGDDGSPNSAPVPERWVDQFKVIGIWPDI